MTENFCKSRIAKNTIILYIRMLFTMWLNLYATRLVLANLGVEDMGVYGVVGSVVSLFSVFYSGITYTIQRFLTFELGKETPNINKVFCSSLNIIFILAIVIILILESVGMWFLCNKVVIPQQSLHVALWVYQLSVLSCVTSFISIPYNALVIAHEKMDAYAIFSIMQVVLSCASAYSLSFFNSHRLFIYAILIAAIGILIQFFYQIYCHFNFRESRYRFMIDKKLLRQIGRFAGITTTHGILDSLYNQGIIIVINWTFGVALNAVYMIALQLKNSVLSFALNIFKAISPQITKTYANSEIETHKKLIYTASKLQVYMIYFIMMPFLFRTDYIMHLWLGEVPPYAVTYAQAIIFISLLYAFFEPIRAAVNATGNIDRFLIFPNIFFILTLPVSYLLSRYTGLPMVLILIIVFVEVIVCIIRVYYALEVLPITMKELCSQVVFPSAIVAIIDATICWQLSINIRNNMMGLILILIFNSIILFSIIYLWGINKQEKNLFRGFFREYLSSKWPF